MLGPGLAGDFAFVDEGTVGNGEVFGGAFDLEGAKADHEGLASEGAIIGLSTNDNVFDGGDDIFGRVDKIDAGDLGAHGDSGELLSVLAVSGDFGRATHAFEFCVGGGDENSDDEDDEDGFDKGVAVVFVFGGTVGDGAFHY